MMQRSRPLQGHNRWLPTAATLTLAIASLALGLGSLSPALAEVRLPAVFSDHMVLQQQRSAPVWGWAAAGEEVRVSIAGQTHKTTADQAGKWRVNLDPLTPGETLTLSVSGQNQLTIQDVLVGEVWLCSGQSNMAMSVNRAQNFEQERQSARYPQLRMFTVARTPKREPQEDCQGTWQVCTPETVASFSATAYFFGRQVHQELKVPVGLINSSYGGTDICAWTSLPAQQATPEVQPVLEQWNQQAESWTLEQAQAQYEKALAAFKAQQSKAKAAGQQVRGRAPRPPVNPRDDQNHPATLFNGMIAPLVPYAIRGGLWYQGERNSSSPETALRYRVQLPLLIADWRSRWGQGDFPFAWVQLPNFTRAGDGWMLVRESMLLSLKVPSTGMAVTIDVGDPKDIHPTNKQAVGERLARWALVSVYGREGAASGPLPAAWEIGDNHVRVMFKHTDGGLVAKDGPLQGFTISADGQTWLPAQARIYGASVIVSHPDVTQPKAVRYAWQDNPVCNLYNGAGLPASPFRTDGQDMPKPE